MYYQRLLEKKVLEYVNTFPVVVIAGARQVGKSTLLAHLFGDTCKSFVFDPVVDVANARTDPDLFLRSHPERLILDEIQYAPELIPAIKRAVDRDRQKGRFILSGSQQWQVMRSLAESLAGRAVFLDLDAFSVRETAGEVNAPSWLERWLNDPRACLRAGIERLKASLSVYDMMWRGWLPETCFIPAATIPDFYQAYVRTYVERDARMAGDVSDWQLFGRFVRLVAALTGQEVNYSELGRDIGLNPQTAKKWLAILSATYQWYEVPAYSGNVLKRISLRPKGYLSDTGFACSMLAISSPEALAGHPAWGALFETLVFGEIRKMSAVLRTKPHWYHWRTYYGPELDILLERDGIFYPIEIKASSRPTRRDARGISAFRARYPHLNSAPGLILCPTEEVYALTENDYAFPWDAL
jgi:uncharacterized protein